MVNPNAGRLGGCWSRCTWGGLPACPIAFGRQDACPTPLPMTMDEARRRGWDEVDVVFVTGDAYVDHPSFAMAILGRVLEAAGFRVGILSQPDWQKCRAWRQFGRPRLFFAISAGNMDSMINHYTANKKVRNDDAYSPGGRIGLRPDRATLAYCQRAREAFPGVPVIAGGVEASLRRLAHYDYWSDKVRRSILLDCKADLVVFGMGEKRSSRSPGGWPPGEIGQRPARHAAAWPTPSARARQPPADAIVLALASRKSRADKLDRSPKRRGSSTTRRTPTTPGGSCSSTTGRRSSPTRRAFPISQAAMDAIYGLPYTRRPHPTTAEPIPAFEMIKDSVTIMRGCFGGCTFCSITAHQGRIIQSRSKESVLAELEQMAADPKFKGTISDIGGPTANMYQMHCTRPEVEADLPAALVRPPDDLQAAGHRPRPARRADAGSPRDARASRRCSSPAASAWTWPAARPSTCDELAQHHVGGHLKVAPEHTDPDVLDARCASRRTTTSRSSPTSSTASRKKAGKKQYIVPYFIASHPGSDLDAMIDLAVFLKRNGYKPDQVQDFIPAPFDVATAHVLHGHRPVHEEAGLHRQAAARTASCSGP